MKSSGQVYVHTMSKKKLAVKGRIPSESEQAQRKRFAAITKMVVQLRKSANAQGKSRKQLWDIATAAYDAANQ